MEITWPTGTIENTWLGVGVVATYGQLLEDSGGGDGVDGGDDAGVDDELFEALVARLMGSSKGEVKGSEEEGRKRK